MVSKKVKVILDIDEGKVEVRLGRTVVSSAGFVFDNSQIIVDDVSTISKYQRMGYGRLLFAPLFLLAQQCEMPLILYSLKEAIPFYESIGMLHLNNKHVQERVKLMNVRKGKKERLINEKDFIWIPNHLQEKPKIYL